MPLVSLSGRELIPASSPGLGLYLAGQCPICGYPIFTHGDGEVALADGKKVYYERETFPTCGCMTSETQVELNVPKVYSAVKERTAVRVLMGIINAFIQRDKLEDSRAGTPDTGEHRPEPSSGYGEGTG